MTNKSVVITGIGHTHPEHVIPNSFFETLDIGTTDDWIVERTGIKSRNSVLSPEQLTDIRHGKITAQELHAKAEITTIADLSEVPWQMANERSGLNSRDKGPDIVICGTSVPDFDIPANACSISGRLGIETTSFDVNSACSSFVAGLHVARSLIQSGAANSAALFNVERYSTRLDYSDRRSCILFGDGSSSTILEGDPDLPGLEIIDTIMHSSPAGYRHVQIPEGQLFTQNGSAVQKFAITKTCIVTEEILQRNNMNISDIQFFAGHQANLRMLITATRRLGFEDSQHLYNVDEFGNQGGSGAPCVLSANWDKIESGDYVLISVVGAGLTWGAALLRMH